MKINKTEELESRLAVLGRVADNRLDHIRELKAENEKLLVETQKDIDAITVLNRQVRKLEKLQTELGIAEAFIDICGELSEYMRYKKGDGDVRA